MPIYSTTLSIFGIFFITPKNSLASFLNQSPTHFLLVAQCFPFLELHIKGISAFVGGDSGFWNLTSCFWDWIHVSVVSYFFVEQYVIEWIGQDLFINSINWQLSCSYFEAFVVKTTNTNLQMSFCEHLCSSPWASRSGTTGSQGRCTFKVIKIYQGVSQSGESILHSQQQCRGVTHTSQSHQYLVLLISICISTFSIWTILRWSNAISL